MTKMKIPLRSFFTLAGIVLVAAKAIAQGPIDPATIQLPVPKHSTAWTIAYAYPGEEKPSLPPGAPPPAPRLTQEKFLLGDKVASVERTYQDGHVTVAYQVDHYELFEHPRTRKIVALDLGNCPSPSQMFRRIYPGFGWVTRKEFVGEASVDNQKCYHFKKDDQEAWLSEDGSLPVAFRDGHMVGHYTFIPLPDDGVQMPPIFKFYLDQLIKNGPPRGQSASVTK